MIKREESVNLERTFHYETTLLPWKEQQDQFMRAYLEFVIASQDGNISAASRVLRIFRPCLYKMMKRCGLTLGFRPVKSKNLANRMCEIVDGVSTGAACESLKGSK